MLAPGRGRARHVLRPEPLTGFEQHAASRRILPGETSIGTVLQSAGNQRPKRIAALLQTHIFLHRHRVEASRHYCAGEDANRATLGDRSLKRMSRRRVADHFKLCAVALLVGGIGERVAVHCRIVMRRDGAG